MNNLGCLKIKRKEQQEKREKISENIKSSLISTALNKNLK